MTTTVWIILWLLSLWFTAGICFFLGAYLTAQEKLDEDVMPTGTGNTGPETIPFKRKRQRRKPRG